MDRLKDTKYEEAQRYIKNALQQDFISDIKKEHLITAYNKLTETNANETLRYVHNWIDGDYVKYNAKKKEEQEVLNGVGLYLLL